MAKDYKIPFDANGNQLHYPTSYLISEWRDNVPFTETLVFEGYSRGRSAAYLNFKRQGTDIEVVVFMTDFVDMVPLMVNGVLTSTFSYCKRGMNYGVKLHGAQNG